MRSLSHALVFALVLVMLCQPATTLAKKKTSDETAQNTEGETKKRKKKRKNRAKAEAKLEAKAQASAEKAATKKSKLAEKTALAAATNGSKPKRKGLNSVSDVELAGVYKAIAQGQSASALGQTEALLLKAPNYKLLHLLRADLLLMLSQRYTVKTAAGASNAFPAMSASHQARIKELQQEAYLRLNSQATLLKASKPQMVPKSLLKLADNEPFALVVDSKASRLYVYQNIANEAPRLVTNFYITQGLQGAFKIKEGDNKTPIGAYFIDGPIAQKLPDLYGYGALNMDYPNAWDKRKGRTGYGIWLHGTPSDTYARAPFASNGCVVLANPDMEMVFKLINSGAMPIVVVDKLEWVDASALAQTRKTLLAAAEQWRDAQAKGDLKAVNKLYSSQYTPSDTDKKSSQTAPVSGSKISNMLLLEYPGEQDLMLLRFDLSSAQSDTVLRKQLYWKKEAGQWKIVLDNTL